MSVVGKSTCSGFKTGLYISYHGGNAVRYIKQRVYFMKDGWISGYFDTKYIAILWIEPILHNFEDQKIANFLNLEQVYFRVTLVISGNAMWYNVCNYLFPQCTIGYGIWDNFNFPMLNPHRQLCKHGPHFFLNQRVLLNGQFRKQQWILLVHIMTWWTL